MKKNFWVIIALFAYFKCKCKKNCTFSNILQKVKSYFFGNIYQSPFDSYWNSKKSIKLKPPSGELRPRLITTINLSNKKESDITHLTQYFKVSKSSNFVSCSCRFNSLRNYFDSLNISTVYIRYKIKELNQV